MSNLTETKQVEKEVVIGKICDYCGTQETNPKVYSEWLYFSEGHGGWGNDSIDSIHWYDVHTAKCFIDMLPKLIKNNDGYPDAEIADMSLPFLKQLLEMVIS